MRPHGGDSGSVNSGGSLPNEHGSGAGIPPGQQGAGTGPAPRGRRSASANVRYGPRGNTPLTRQRDLGRQEEAAGIGARRRKFVDELS